MKLSKTIFFLLLFVLVLPACSKNEAKKNNDSWKNEVLMMEECGSDGLRCCMDRDDPCSFGQTCCIDPNNPDRHYCADECSFGKLDEFCMVNNKCEGTLVCMGGTCLECGLSNHVCCEGEKKCLGEGLENEEKTECVSNVCSPCGHSGKGLCLGDEDCLLGYFYNNGKCLSCGKFNQPCCRGDEGPYCVGEGLFCDLGFCVEK